MNVIPRVIKQAGGAKKLATSLGISRQAVEQWRLVPPERVLLVESITGISRYELRPDIYGPMPKREAAQAA